MGIQFNHQNIYFLENGVVEEINVVQEVEENVEQEEIEEVIEIVEVVPKSPIIEEITTNEVDENDNSAENGVESPVSNTSII